MLTQSPDSTPDGSARFPWARLANNPSAQDLGLLVALVTMMTTVWIPDPACALKTFSTVLCALILPPGTPYLIFVVWRRRDEVTISSFSYPNHSPPRAMSSVFLTQRFYGLAWFCRGCLYPALAYRSRLWSSFDRLSRRAALWISVSK